MLISYNIAPRNDTGGVQCMAHAQKTYEVRDMLQHQDKKWRDSMLDICQDFDGIVDTESQQL